MSDDTKTGLEARAAQKARSIGAELRDILDTAPPEAANPDDMETFGMR